MKNKAKAVNESGLGNYGGSRLRIGNYGRVLSEFVQFAPDHYWIELKGQLVKINGGERGVNWWPVSGELKSLTQ